MFLFQYSLLCDQQLPNVLPRVAIDINSSNLIQIYPCGNITHRYIIVIIIRTEYHFSKYVNDLYLVPATEC